MRVCFVGGYLFCAAFLGVSSGQGADLEADPVLMALKPELKRNLHALALPGQPLPYYLAFSHVTSERVSVMSRLGDVSQDDLFRQCYVQARIRVGTTGFDNTNFAGYVGTSGTVRATTQERDPGPLVRDAWLAADAAYKRAIEAYAAKVAALKRERRENRPCDFSLSAPLVHYEDQAAMTGLERARLRETARNVSAALREFPSVQRAMVRANASAKTVRLLDSDGMEHRQCSRSVRMLVTADTQADDGTPLRDVFSVMAPGAEELPPLDYVKEMTRGMARRLAERARAEGLPGPYLGPVLFTARASAEFVRQTLAEDFSGTPSPVVERDGLKARVRGGQLARFLGLRILPSWMDVTDDPGRGEWRGTPLLGTYDVDREGVSAARVRLVSDGMLRAFLMSRTPAREFKESNGHGRIVAGNMIRASSSNLFVDARKTESWNKLVKRLLKLAKKDGLEFGLIVRHLDEPPGSSGHPRRINVGTGSEDPEEAPSRWAISAALDVVRVDVRTGKETRLRGAIFGPIGLTELKGILAAGRESAVYSYIASPQSIDRYQGYTEGANCSIVAPPLLFSQLELRPMAKKRKPLPFLAHPLAQGE